ncbi:hypothetical protein C3F09_10020 [candidate division GN15 bacterium]|uniref:Prepilin-type N-terminal cleavage/methylation domain-containing protein n=1 Tax=candidate division GN15 bacterium TaxID=2072418 RepID=A0A855X4I1_9BACT|nr:MAG: hypothetical protein C3F09_10020 [candidate division GN15 bacterium]
MVGREHPSGRNAPARTRRRAPGVLHSGMGGGPVLNNRVSNMRIPPFSFSILRPSRGFTLVEVVLVLVISAILVTVALRSGLTISDAAKVEETKQEMESLEHAIVGNPALQNAGVRADFGYVGDVGAMPPTLAALATNPGGYATWKGPYVKARFAQTSDDFTRDAWGATYAYAGGVALTSTGSGSSIVRTFGNSTDNLLRNTITGSVFDVDGTPPGILYRDSIRLNLTVPNGTGGMTTRTIHPGASGYFALDSVPIGNHPLRAVYLPGADTVATFVSVLPGSRTNSELRFASDLWAAGGSTGLILVPNSDSVAGSPPCTDVVFWLTNTSGAAIVLTSFSFSWPSPTAYYAEVRFGSAEVFDKDGSPRGVSGTTYAMSSPQTINPGDSVRVRVQDFRQTNSSGGGSTVSMSEANMTVALSNGSIFTMELPPCP